MPKLSALHHSLAPHVERLESEVGGLGSRGSNPFEASDEVVRLI